MAIHTAHGYEEVIRRVIGAGQAGAHEDPTSGHLFVFINRKRTQMKVLYFDRSGYCVWGKRLEQGRFQYRSDGADKMVLDWTQLKLLLEGIDPRERRQYKRYRHRHRQAEHAAVKSCAMSSAQKASASYLGNTVTRAEYDALQEQVQSLERQLEWFKRQLFGEKSEKRLDVDPAIQGNLLSALGVAPPPAPKDESKETITYQRRMKARDGAVNVTDR